MYYKKYSDYAARLYRPEAVLQPAGFDDVTSDIPYGLEPLSSIGTGRSYGVELQLQKKFSTVPLYGLVSLTANRSEYAGVDSVYYTGSFETRFIGNLLAGWRFNPKWEVSGKYRLATGLPYTPFAASGPAEGERDFAQYNQQRLPTYSAVDIRIDRRWSFRAVQLDVYLHRATPPSTRDDEPGGGPRGARGGRRPRPPAQGAAPRRPALPAPRAPPCADLDAGEEHRALDPSAAVQAYLVRADAALELAARDVVPAPTMESRASPTRPSASSENTNLQGPTPGCAPRIGQRSL